MTGRRSGSGSHTGAPSRFLVWIAAAGAGLLLVISAVMNLTPGHFGYADRDGCTCIMAYTVYPSVAACDRMRTQQCDGSLMAPVLLYLARLDAYR
jgi:hypothetical protein